MYEDLDDKGVCGSCLFWRIDGVSRDGTLVGVCTTHPYADDDEAGDIITYSEIDRCEAWIGREKRKDN